MGAMLASVARRLRDLRWFLRPRREVPVARFDVDAGRWVDVESAAALERDTLTVATFNIWFSDYWAVERYRAIARILSKRSPDVILLQEVTSVALQEFLAQPWVRDNYCHAAAVGDDFGNYGLLVLSRLPIGSATYTRLPSGLERGFLAVHYTVNRRPLTVCCVHLESGKRSSGLRAHQLARVFGALRSVNDVVVAGDFNMRDTENDRIITPYVDVWPALRPDDEGYTEDTSINVMRWDSKPKDRHVRFDRVLVKGTGWSPTAIELLGTKPISSASPRVFPSDHFGVLCRMVRR
jgi:tyrosyl-DNA phosphodiesterase 2